MAASRSSPPCGSQSLLFDEPPAAAHFIPVQDLLSRVRSTGILPLESETHGLSPEDRDAVAKAWFAGCHEIADRAWVREREQFAARGWAFAYLLEDRSVAADARYAAVEAVDRYYPAVLARGLDRAEDMGLLAHMGFGGTEGVRAKRLPYDGQSILVSICATTGPLNFDPASGRAEFEQGAKSHLFHLHYRDALPSADQLAGDLAALPLRPAEIPLHRWLSEGWTGTHETRPVVLRSWSEFAGPACAAAALAASGGRVHRHRR